MKCLVPKCITAIMILVIIPISVKSQNELPDWFKTLHKQWENKNYNQVIQIINYNNPSNQSLNKSLYYLNAFAYQMLDSTQLAIQYYQNYLNTPINFEEVPMDHWLSYYVQGEREQFAFINVARLYLQIMSYDSSLKYAQKAQNKFMVGCGNDVQAKISDIIFIKTKSLYMLGNLDSALREGLPLALDYKGNGVDTSLLNLCSEMILLKYNRQELTAITLDMFISIPQAISKWEEDKSLGLLLTLGDFQFVKWDSLRIDIAQKAKIIDFENDIRSSLLDWLEKSEFINILIEPYSFQEVLQMLNSKE